MFSEWTNRPLNPGIGSDWFRSSRLIYGIKCSY
jgi:hypothetical protein